MFIFFFWNGLAVEQTQKHNKSKSWHQVTCFLGVSTSFCPLFPLDFTRFPRHKSNSSQPSAYLRKIFLCLAVCHSVSAASLGKIKQWRAYTQCTQHRFSKKSQRLDLIISNLIEFYQYLNLTFQVYEQLQLLFIFHNVLETWPNLIYFHPWPPYPHPIRAWSPGFHWKRLPSAASPGYPGSRRTAAPPAGLGIHDVSATFRSKILESVEKNLENLDNSKNSSGSYWNLPCLYGSKYVSISIHLRKKIVK